MVVDSHHHLWLYTDDEFGWIADEVLRTDFTAIELARELFTACVDRTIVCEARQCVDETEVLLDTARKCRSIAGVVGWLPIADKKAFPALLEKFRANPRLVGLRHVVQDEPDDEFILRPDFMDGVRRLRGTGLVYDILVFQRQLANAVRFVDAMPGDQQFVLDHIGKPKPGREDEWRELVRAMARRENVACKFSGVVTEIGTDPAAIRLAFDTVLEAFGPRRLMWGSDWPVVTAHESYKAWRETVDGLVAPLSESEREAILGGNAMRVYGMEGRT